MTPGPERRDLSLLSGFDIEIPVFFLEDEANSQLDRRRRGLGGAHTCLPPSCHDWQRKHTYRRGCGCEEH